MTVGANSAMPGPPAHTGARERRHPAMHREVANAQ